MATVQEVIADRTRYPDTTEFIGPDGIKTTVGEMRNQFIPKGDYTKETQRYAQERQQLEQQFQSQLGTFQQQLAQLNQQLARQGQPQVQTADELAQWRDDPTFRPFVNRLDQAMKVAQEAKTLYEQQAARLQQHEQAWWLNQHAQTIRGIQQRDTDFQDRTKVNELVEYAKAHGLSNLDLAHQLMTRDRDIQNARDTAAADALEKAKQVTNTPHIPNGSSSVAPTVPPGQTWTPPADAGAFEAFNKAEEAAVLDDAGALEKLGAEWSQAYQGRV